MERIKRIFILGAFVAALLGVGACNVQGGAVPAITVSGIQTVIPVTALPEPTRRPTDASVSPAATQTAVSIVGQDVIPQEQAQKDAQEQAQKDAGSWRPREFLLSAYNPPYAWREPPYEDATFLYYKNANFDNFLWVRDDDALMQKVHEHGFKYFFDVGSVIGEDLLRGSPDSVPPQVTDEMLRRLDAAIDKYKDDPDLIGYYICDEPFPSGFQNIARVMQRIKEKDPARVSLVNLWPYFENEIGDDDYIEDFIQTTKAELLCADRYNFFTGWDENDEYLAELARIRKHALQHHIPFYFIVQAVGTQGTSVGTPGGGDEYLEWRTPNRAEHRWLVYSALTYGVHGLIWFHWDGQDWGVIQNPDREIIYPSLQSINAEISVLKEIMLHLTTTYVYQTKDVQAAMGAEPARYLINAADDADLLVGFFRDDGGNEDYFMLMNKSYSEPVAPEITINAVLDSLQAFNVENNRWEEIPFEKKTSSTVFTVHLRKGGGRLFKFKQEDAHRLLLPLTLRSYP